MQKTIDASDTKFRLGRPSLPNHTAAFEPDPYAKRAIDELARALGSEMWPNPEPAADGAYTALIPTLPRAQKTAKGAASGAEPDGSDTAPERHHHEPAWRERLERMLKCEPCGPCSEHPGPDPTTLEMVLARDGQTSLLYETRQHLGWRDLSFNARTLLQPEALLHYLFADAVYRLHLKDPIAIAGYMRDEDERGGLRRLYEVVAVEAVKDLVQREKIEVDGVQQLLADIGPEIKSGGYSFEPGVFDKRIRQAVKGYAFDRTTVQTIRAAAAKLGLVVTPSELDFLVRYAGKSQIGLTPLTAEHLVTIALTQRRNASLNLLSADGDPAATADFAVSYHTETHDALAVNRNNVLCAAQLFYVMTLGDELGVFTAVDLLISRYLTTGVVDIHSPELLQDLQNYVLNEEFPDLKTGRTYRRTSPEERRMFYRQVFNYGDAGLTEGMVSNTDFEMLWNALMLESVKYIEKVEQSERPESFVSRQNIAQAVEDLQYNLSTHGSGMAKVMAPVMYKELDFIIERIFKRPEIISQLALHNSQSYWKVIERILLEHYRQGLNLTALQNKARYGHQILDRIARYTTQTIDDDQEFSGLVSLIEAFIIAGEQLETRERSLFQEEEPQPAPAGGNGYHGSDDWDF